MYIQDEKQKIVGNLDIEGKWGESYQSSQMWTLVFILPEIGAYVTFQDESYVILRTETFQEEGPESGKSVIVTKCLLLRINDEGDDMGKEPIWGYSDELELI